MATREKKGTRSAKSDTGEVRENTKDLLLRVAIEEIDRVGEARVRLDDILRESGVSVSSLYHFYGSMRGLLDEAQLARFDADTGANIKQFHDAVVRCANVEQFRSLVEATVNEVYSKKRARNRSTLMNAFGAIFETPGYQERVVRLEDENIAVLSAAFEHAKRQGFIASDVDNKSLAIWVIGLTFSRVLPDILDDDESVDGWIRITTASLLHVMGL